MFRFSDIKKSFPKVFQGASYCIQLNPNAQPFSVNCPSRIPIHLRDKVKKELDRMLKEGIITKTGRFYFNSIPFGITSVPEHFQKRILGIIGGLEGVSNLSHDFLVYRETKEEHDRNLRLLLLLLLQRLESHRLTLSGDKCEFKVTSLSFLGHLITNGKAQ